MQAIYPHGSRGSGHEWAFLCWRGTGQQRGYVLVLPGKKLVCYGQYHPNCTVQPQLEILKSASTGMFANIYELLMLPWNLYS